MTTPNLNIILIFKYPGKENHSFRILYSVWISKKACNTVNPLSAGKWPVLGLGYR